MELRLRRKLRMRKIRKKRDSNEIYQEAEEEMALK
jgi:hypothetical protein